MAFDIGLAVCFFVSGVWAQMLFMRIKGKNKVVRSWEKTKVEDARYLLDILDLPKSIQDWQFINMSPGRVLAQFVIGCEWDAVCARADEHIAKCREELG